jgi:uncharacterized membrane protein YcaP (DUF421 family)
MHRSVTWIKSRSSFLAEIIDGVPLVLLQKGEWQMEAMRKLRLSEEDVMAVGRTKGIRSITEIRYATLERNGALSIIKAQ